MSTLEQRLNTAGAAMLLAAGLTLGLTPTQKMADARAPVVLEQMIPREFGDWTIDPSVTPLMISPDLQARLDKLYNQTLARTYVDKQGDRVMLSIAYGGDQRGDMHVHLPEVCYPAQGFQVLSNQPGDLVTSFGAIPVRRLETSLTSQRLEPVTYWITIGDQYVTGRIQRKFAQLAYGLRGTIADGLLFRVSSIDPASARAFEVQGRFVNQLLSAIDPAARRRIAGAAVHDQGPGA
jgi:EpsI family protein